MERPRRGALPRLDPRRRPDDRYNNRAVMWVRPVGRIVEHEDYEDTERTAAYDADLAAVTSTG